MEHKEIEIKNIELLENIRMRPAKEDLSELMNSIKQTGLMQPIGVKKQPKGYTLLWGYRRLCAYKKLGWIKIPARIFLNDKEILSEEEFLIINATENIQRRQTNVIELGRICLTLRNTLSIGEIASRLSIPISRVSESISAFKVIPKKYRDKVEIFEAGTKNRAGKLPASLVNNIVRLRGISSKQKEKLLDWADKERIVGQKIETMGLLLREGIELKQAMRIVQEARSITIKLVIGKDFFIEMNKNENTPKRVIVELLRSKFGKDKVF